jgi:hypothetical protein
VEFVHENEVADLLDEHRLKRVTVGEDCIYLEMDSSDELVHVHLKSAESRAEPRNGASVHEVDRARLPKLVEHIIHLLHMEQILLMPVGKWRKVFDAVAFSLAENEDWQEIDAAATVELNTRDPLLCEPADFHTLIALIEALLNDAENPDQGLMLVPTAAPVLIEIIPDGAVRVDLGNAVLADELNEIMVK